MDLGNYHPYSFTDPTGDHFESNCWHVLSQYGSGNNRPCLKCGLLREQTIVFNCTHCNDFCNIADFYILDGDWITFPDGSENFKDDNVYQCASCNKISINPEVKYIVKWIKNVASPNT